MKSIQFKIEKKTDTTFFNGIYNKIFNEKWYPDYFLNNGYSVFFSKRKYIGNEENENLNKSPSSHKIIEFLTNSFKDNKILVKTYDFTEEQPIKELIIPIDIFTKNYIHEVEKLMLLNSEITSDEGMVIFGDSYQWAYYLGEELYGNFNMDEFELFIIKNEESENLKLFIKEMYPNTIIKKKTNENIFKDNMIFEDSIFEILGD